MEMNTVTDNNIQKIIDAQCENQPKWSVRPGTEQKVHLGAVAKSYRVCWENATEVVDERTPRTIPFVRFNQTQEVQIPETGTHCVDITALDITVFGRSSAASGSNNDSQQEHNIPGPATGCYIELCK
jgi:hypothetical protein